MRAVTPPVKRGATSQSPSSGERDGRTQFRRSEHEVGVNPPPVDL